MAEVTEAVLTNWLLNGNVAIVFVWRRYLLWTGLVMNNFRFLGNYTSVRTDSFSSYRTIKLHICT